MKQTQRLLPFLLLALTMAVVACDNQSPLPNQPPTAIITAIAEPDPWVAPVTVTFTASASSDPDGAITAYRWAIDGAPVSTAKQFQYMFSAPATYRVALEVTDDDGATHEATATYVVTAGAVKFGEGDITIDIGAGSAREVLVESNEPWALTSSTPWLAVDPATGDAGATQVTLTVDVASLPPHPSAVLTLATASGATDAINVFVTAPVLTDPTPRALEARAWVGYDTTKTFGIGNSGDGTLLVDLQSPSPWLTVTPSSAVIAPNATTAFYVSATCSSPAPLNGTITVNSNSPGLVPTTIDVNLDCVPEPASDFEITLRFFGDTLPTPEQQAVFESAARRWSEVIVGDLPGRPVSTTDYGSCGDDIPALDEHVDDLLIFVKVEPIDGVKGVLGKAGPCLYRDAAANKLPIVGLIEVDSADFDFMATTGLLADVILHEMGHVLGIGTYWELPAMGHSHLDVPCHYPMPGPVRFTGAQANDKHVTAGGAPGQLLVETGRGPGTACGHWHEDAYQAELMTGLITGPDNPLSAITIGSLADLGYQVEYALADPYNVPPPGALRAQSDGPRINLENFLRPTPKAFE